MRFALTSLAFAAVVSASPALALQSEEQLARERGCFACHDVAQYKIAPSFKAVSLKFRGNHAMALPRFTAALRDGIGHPKSTMTEEEIAILSSR
jgi:cytochrome c